MFEQPVRRKEFVQKSRLALPEAVETMVKTIGKQKFSATLWGLFFQMVAVAQW